MQLQTAATLHNTCVGGVKKRNNKKVSKRVQRERRRKEKKKKKEEEKVERDFTHLCSAKTILAFIACAFSHIRPVCST